MSYKYSKGAQVIGDLKAEDDTQRDTLIDFGEDQIQFETSGSVRVKITNSETIFTHTVHISGSEIEGLRLGKGGANYKQIVFETDGADGANIQLSNAENLVIMNETNGKDIQFWTNPSAASLTQQMVIKEGGNIGVGTTSPDYELHVVGAIKNTGAVYKKTREVTSFPYTVANDDYVAAGHSGRQAATSTTAYWLFPTSSTVVYSTSATSWQGGYSISTSSGMGILDLFLALCTIHGELA